MKMTRRGFMQSILIAGMMPAIVRADSLMACVGLTIPTQQLILPEKLIVQSQALSVGRILTVGEGMVEYLDCQAEGLVEMRRYIDRRGRPMVDFALPRPNYTYRPGQPPIFHDKQTETAYLELHRTDWSLPILDNG